jgi:DNA-binding winged helix-turn-helix (wHTH) protein
VLLYLLEHRDRVVPKQELAEQLWPDPYISDTVIENSILAARRAIGDSGRAQRIIQTLHGHGYRLIVPVTTADDTEEGPEDRPSAVADAEETPWTEALLPAVEEIDAAQRVEGADVAPMQSTAASPPSRRPAGS